MIKHKKKLTNLFYFTCALAITTFPSFAFADALDTEFEPFMDSVKSLITGRLGKAVALIALPLGGLMGLMGLVKSSTWLALTGFAIAAVFGLGPFLIETIFSTFSAIGS